MGDRLLRDHADVRSAGEISGGFLGRYGLTYFAGAIFTLWLRSQYPSAETLTSLGFRLEWLARERGAFVWFVVFLGLYNPAVWFGLRTARRIAGGLATVAGATTLVFGALAYGQAPWSGLGTIANFLVAALALGAATTGLAVGHSYLTLPMSPRPLRDITIVLFLALLVQIVSLPFYLGLIGSRAAAEKGSALLGTYGLILGVRLAIGLLFPIVLAGLAWHTTRMKAMRSATGLLYIGSGVILTGEIVAKVLFFIGGIPV
ncbi:MAG: hypothetical protein U0232_00320 [Thermomicrobiales bacterium]